MSLALPTIVRTSARIVFSGALAIGLLTSAPVAEAQAAPVHAAAKAKAKAKPKLTRVQRAMKTAVAQKGDRYAYGAAGPNRFDCSGLTYYSFRKAGFSRIPRTSSAQAHFARHISRAAMKRGDLIFFNGGGRVYHVGVFAGWDRGKRLVLHAPYSGTRVRTERMWTNAWFPGTLRGR